MNFADTGYKPQFALGALYHADNASDAQFGNQLDFVKQLLSNYKQEQEIPLDLQVKSYEAALAKAKELSPTYIPKALEGYEGQMNSQIAAGNKSMQTWESVANVENLKNETEGRKLGLQNLLYKLKEGNVAKVAAGEVPQSGQGPLPILGRQGRAQKMNENNSRFQGPAPLRNGGINQGDAEYEAAMQALVDTPEMRQALVKTDQKLDSAEYLKMMALQNAMSVAAMRGGGRGGDDVKKAEQILARVIEKKRRGEQLTENDIWAYNQASDVVERNTSPRIQPGIQINPNVAPNVMQPKPEQKLLQRLGENPAPKFKGTGTKEDPIKLD
jgi:hypothetical protein